MPSAGDLIQPDDFDETLVANTSAFQGMRFETGTVGVAVDTSGSYFTQAVVFEDPFNEAPVVVVANKQDNGGAVCTVLGVVDSVTTTGFTAYARSGDDGNFSGAITFDMDWIAVGP